ncbi:hypothetical protein OZX68_06080 [Streptococcaceae bacterium ESL0729]|nr:hypothetical protein OZX68_06080 [Streptococcaceae bacterium ESL0729]
MKTETNFWDYSLAICLLGFFAVGNILGIFLGNLLYWMNISLSVGYLLGLGATIVALKKKQQLGSKELANLAPLLGLSFGLLCNSLIVGPYGMLAILLGTAMGSILGQLIKKTSTD